MELTNKFRTLIVTYPKKEDVNISMMMDDLNNKPIQKGITDRSVLIEYIKKPGDFHVELIDYDGEVKFDSNSYDDAFFDKLFDTIDNLPVGETDAATLSTETVSIDIPSDESDQEVIDQVDEIERLENDQERDDEPIGVTYPEDSLSEDKITRADYLRWKKKYLKLKSKLN